jgi:tetratricopeptide (TPR) repeat protein/tRNA A-37 threonylcarbamoyl transferase component Bud32
MSTSLPSGRDDTLGSAFVSHLDALLRAWEQCTPDRSPPRWQDYLPPSGACPAEFLLGLLSADILGRLRAGQPALLAEPYFDDARLREAAGSEADRLLALLVRQEYQERWCRGQRPRRSEYLARFSQLHESLRDLVPTLDCRSCGQEEVPLADEDAEGVDCPRCGCRLSAPLAPSTIPPPAHDAGAGWDTTVRPSAAPQAAKPRPSRRLGRYELGEEIAHGGMGAIFLARDPTLNRDLAVKVLRPELHDHPDLVRRFVEEAQITAQLPHPGIVPVHELGQDDHGLPFLAMKLVRGQTLQQLLAQRSSPAEDLPHLVGIFEQVCQAVAFAHSRRVVHRDLKPANVMVGHFGEVQVMDWGLAKPLDHVPTEEDKAAGETAATVIRTLRTEAAAGLVETTAAPAATKAGIVLGTPAYMPPEQANGQVQRLDERCDVFGLGAILCEVLSGQPPYVAQSSRHLLHLAAQGELTEAFARLDGRDADAELVALVKECLSPELEKRPRDAGVVAERVAAYQRGVQERLRQAEQQRAAAEARAQEARATARAQRRLVLVVVAAVLAAGLAGGWYWQERTRRQTQAESEAGAALREAATNLEGEEEQARRDPERWQAQVNLAEAAVHRAEMAMASAAVAQDLRESVLQMRTRVDAKRRDSDLRVELDRIRLDKATFKEGQFDGAAAVPRYRAALSGYGVALGDAPPAAAVVRGSGLRDELLAALMDWARYTPDVAERKQLAAVLVAAEPEAESWRGRWWSAVRRRDGAALAAVVSGAGELAAPDLVNLAKDLGRLGQVATAERLLREGQRRFPGDFWVNHELGILLYQQGPAQTAEAVPYLTAAVALRSQSPQAHVNLGAALQAQGKSAQAVEQIRAAITLDPTYAMPHYNLGVILQEQGKLAEAIVEYHKAIALDPRYAMAHCNLGTVLRLHGQLAEAIEEYRKAIALAPRHAQAHYNLGLALQAQGQWAEAVDEYHKAIDLDPKLVQAHLDLGNVLQAQGKLEEAIKEYREASALDPKDARPHNNLGVALHAQGKLPEAVQECREAIALNPRDARPHINLGVALREQGKLAKAVQQLREAITLDPKDAKAHQNLGLALEAQGKWAEAVDEYHKAIDLDPRGAQAHYNLGHVLKEQGKLAEALEEYRAAIALDPRDARPHHNLGIVLQEQGQLAEAIEEYRKAIALDPTLAEAHGVLGEALLQRGDFTEAAQATRRCLELLPPQHPLRPPVSSQLHRCQTAQALDAKLPGILRGDARPADAAEGLALAQLCEQYKQLHVAAARFYAEAFAAEPKLAADLRAQHRYNAACSAALAAAAKGNDAASLAEPDRAQLRRQALDWLRADMKAYHALLAKNKDAAAAVQQILTHWRDDPELASVRDPAALGKLPDAERDACKKLWADVAALLDKIKAPR